MSADGIRWPAEFDPAVAPIHAVNRLDMRASPEAVWKVLIRASEWPQYYANASGVRVQDGGCDLFSGATFRWRTFGVSLVSRVEEFVPNERIAWNAKAFGVWVYHAWLITPTSAGCHVVTEETQYGFLARASRMLFPANMERWHQRWLEGLAARAEKL
jgi:uncharacterized protein YndB with AHSA1/START domain